MQEHAGLENWLCLLFPAETVVRGECSHPPQHKVQHLKKKTFFFCSTISHSQQKENNSIIYESGWRKGRGGKGHSEYPGFIFIKKRRCWVNLKKATLRYCDKHFRLCSDNPKTIIFFWKISSKKVRMFFACYITVSLEEGEGG